MPLQPKYLTIAEVAKDLRLHPTTVAKAVGRGEIKAKRIGRTWRIPASELTRLEPREEQR